MENLHYYTVIGAMQKTF